MNDNNLSEFDDGNDNSPEDNGAKNDGDSNQFELPDFVSADTGKGRELSQIQSPIGFRPGMKGTIERQFGKLNAQIFSKL